MADAATQHKKMPDRMIKQIPGPCIKKDAGRVEDASQGQQKNTSRSHIPDQRPDRTDDQPTHDYIEDR